MKSDIDETRQVTLIEPEHLLVNWVTQQWNMCQIANVPHIIARYRDVFDVIPAIPKMFRHSLVRVLFAVVMVIFITEQGCFDLCVALERSPKILFRAVQQEP